MNPYGIVFALAALAAWTVGDFFIQKTTRALGNVKTLFYICLVAFVAYFPFIYKDLPALFTQRSDLLFLLGTSAITLIASFLDFEALKKGKFAVIEPIYGLELPVTVILSLTIAREQLNPLQFLCITATFLGILLVSVKSFKEYKGKHLLEPGVLFGIFGAAFMGITNFMFGQSSREISVLMTMWFVHTFLLVFCTAILIARNQARNLISDFKNNAVIVTIQSTFDNISWLFYSFATTLIPISIATTISESYIAFAALMGMYFNKEKLVKHQFIGIFIVFASIILLSNV